MRAARTAGNCFEGVVTIQTAAVLLSILPAALSIGRDMERRSSSLDDKHVLMN